MILGTDTRVPPGLLPADLEDPFVKLDVTDLLEPPAWPDPRDHRDRGNFLTPRLYPSAPFEPFDAETLSM